MDEREANVILKLRDRKVQLVPILAVFVHVHAVQQLLRKRADDRLLVIVDDILEELVDKLHLEVREVEARIVVAIELVREVQHNFVSLALLRWEDEFVDEALADVLHLPMARDQAVKFELDLVRRIQIRYAFMFVGYQYALKIEKLVVRITSILHIDEVHLPPSLKMPWSNQLLQRACKHRPDPPPLLLAAPLAPCPSPDLHRHAC